MFSSKLIAAIVALGGTMPAATAAQAALVIRDAPTRNVSCSAGVCTARARAAVINVGELTSMLASSDVTLVTGKKAKDVKVRSALSWASTHRLTLDAHRSILVEKAVTISGAGALTLTTNDGGSGGTFATEFPARIDFWDLSSSLIINGASYTLVGDISTFAADIAASAANASGRYALARNYDAGPDGTYIDAPISTTFNGTFEGLGHLIKRLTVRGGGMNAATSLFSQIGAGALIENIGLTEVKMDGARKNHVGALAAWNFGSIVNAFAKGRVVGEEYGSYVGGLVGENEGSITLSYTTGKVVGKGDTEIGGLAGASEGSIRDSHSTADVVDTANVNDSYAGGLVGRLLGSLSDSWASGDVIIGDDYRKNHLNGTAGGLVGFYFYDLTFGDHPDLRNCYATGSVTAGQNTNVGGLIGILDVSQGTTPAPITTSYAAGRTVGGAGTSIGAVVGYIINDGSFSDTYWDTDTTGVTDPSKGVGNIPNEPGVTGLSDAQLTSGLPAGFDPTVWAENPSINGGRPYLIANPPAP